ncbi:MAG: hypothetical protein R8P61_22765 [Bacteroidia bacterium]|nr:hypothetical protein [Bacteroidia bacterium]
MAGKNISRRRFIVGFLMLLLGVLAYVRFFSTPASRLKKRLSRLGFEVEKEELQKFWEAWFMQMENQLDAYSFRYPIHYLREPLEDRVKLFLYSSNALTKNGDEPIRFIKLYTPYERPCFHPFLAAE